MASSVDTLGRCVGTESVVRSPSACLVFLSSVLSELILYRHKHEIAPDFLMVLVMRSYRWFESGFVLRGLHT